MRVLVTGGAGYIGSHMAHHLIDDGRSVVVVDNLSTGVRELVPDEAEFHELDVRDTVALEKLMASGNVDGVLQIGCGDGAHALAFSAAALPARRPNTTHSRRELPIIRLRPCVPPAISPQA